MSITAAEVNKLRKQTGAGMMDCKKALTEAEGDFDKAIEILRLKGQKVAAKRGDRETSEGAVLATANAAGDFGVLMSLNCETDFVAKNEEFVEVATRILNVAIEEGITEKPALMAAAYSDEGISIEDKITEQIGKIGEKIEVGSFHTLSAAHVAAYIHPGNRLATLVGFSANVGDGARDVAMQAAAMAPVALNEDSIPADLIEKEKSIGKELAIQEGKPEEMASRIAEGRLKKWFKEATLVNQAFIKDNKVNVAQYVQSLNGDAIVTGFCREALD
ncbi:MAG TPA: elongation factor Ts [Flavobacteriales bacterium]|nr:elongation factor Ts [Flavobacteriales bacterium]|tara:strand:- start:4385 stop:5209 length:825 start_codon:yes stop_codon:yes gene_type:complete